MTLGISFSAVRLGMNSVPVATAASIYHKFFQATDLNKFDPYVSFKKRRFAL